MGQEAGGQVEATLLGRRPAPTTAAGPDAPPRRVRPGRGAGVYIRPTGAARPQAWFLLARVQRLSEPAQQVLRVAAVAGRRVPHRLLAEAAGRPEDDLERGLREAIGAGVLVADSTSGPTHLGS